MFYRILADSAMPKNVISIKKKEKFIIEIGQIARLNNQRIENAEKFYQKIGSTDIEKLQRPLNM